jgi:hypothetical protein
MKKILTLLLLSLAFTIAYSTPDTTKLPVYKDADTQMAEARLATLNDTTKITWSTVYSDVKEGLKGLGEALKTGSEHVYGVLVRQQIVKAFSRSIAIIFTLFAAYILFQLGRKAQLRFIKDREDSDNTLMVIYYVIAGILAVIGLINFGCGIDNILTGFINPEYGAIEDIYDFIKDKK